MTKLNSASIPPHEILKPLPYLMRKWYEGDETVRRLANTASANEAENRLREYLIEMVGSETVFLNDTYQVHVRKSQPMAEGMPPMIHLSMKRIDRQPVHDWRDIQEIKNQIVGPECEGIELYPAESRRVDAANQYHLWCFSDPTIRFPVGFTERFVSEDSVGGSVQRKL